MNRRTFNKLAGLAALATLADIEMNAEQSAIVAGEVILQDSEFLVAFDPATGALTRMEHKPTKWIVERRPALGASFRMLVPFPADEPTLCWGRSRNPQASRRFQTARCGSFGRIWSASTVVCCLLPS